MSTIPSDLIFNSRRSPGSVVVYQNRYPVAIITVSRSETLKVKKGAHFAVPLTMHEDVVQAQRVQAIPAGTYAEIKAALIKALQPSPVKEDL